MLQKFEAVLRILQMLGYANAYTSKSSIFDSNFNKRSTIDCQNVNSDDVPIVEITKTENEPLEEQQVVEESYVIENEIPVSCYSIAPKKKQLNVLTRDIIESAIECVVLQAAECQRDNVSAKTAELLVIEEFGRCFEEIRRLSNLQNFLN